MNNDIRDWLQALGLAKYGDDFVYHDIGLDVIGSPTEDHLKAAKAVLDDLG